MKKNAQFFLLILSLVALTACDERIGEKVIPAPTYSIVGKWSMTGFGTITSSKTFEASLEEIKKAPGADVTQINVLVNQFSFEFKEDGTYTSGVETGTWKLSNDKKIVSLSPKGILDASGKQLTKTLQVLELTSNALTLGTKKFSTDASGEITVKYDELNEYMIAYLAIKVKGTKLEVDFANPIQGTMIFKR